MASRAEERKRWGQILNRWHASGQSMAAFCRTQRIAYWRLKRWSKRLEVRQERKALTLIPVLARGKHATRGAPLLGSTAGAVAVRIRLPGEVAIEIEEGIDPELLLRVVELLREQAPC